MTAALSLLVPASHWCLMLHCPRSALSPHVRMKGNPPSPSLSMKEGGGDAEPGQEQEGLSRSA